MKWTQANPGSATQAFSADAEIIANLWYIIDDQGFIYSLRAMAYVATGSEADKLQFLASRAYLDYLVARPFQVPERYGTTFVGSNGEETKYAVIHHDSTSAIGGIDQLFFDALDQMQSDLPAQTTLSIPASPLIKITALYGGEDGSVVPIDSLGRGNGEA